MKTFRFHKKQQKRYSMRKCMIYALLLCIMMACVFFSSAQTEDGVFVKQSFSDTELSNYAIFYVPYAWDFGDEMTSAAKSPTYVYTNPAIFEARLTLATYAINFQPAGAITPKGYVADTGAAYSIERGYGWDRTIQSMQRDSYPDPLLDTYVYVTNTSPATWRYDLPNTDYLVSLTACSPQFTGRHTVAINGIVVIDDVRTSEGEQVNVFDWPVRVTDGALHVTIGGSNNTKKTKLCFLSITPNEPVEDTLPPALSGQNPMLNATGVPM